MKKTVVILLLTLITSVNSFALDRYTVSNLVKQLKPAVVTVSHQVKQQNQAGSAVASGVIVSSNGFVITNYHAVQGSKKVQVKLNNNKIYSAKVASFDKKTDIAILKIETYDAFPFVYFANSDKVEVGEVVFAIGSPYGLEHSVSMGIISGKNRVTGNLGYEDFLQTDASINPGNSGGPLFNLDGRLIGINTAALMPNGSTNGIGFAIPSNLVKRIVNDLKDNGVVNRPTLGIKVTDITPEIKEKLNLDRFDGAVIYKIERESPVLSKGIIAGDTVIKFNGKLITRASDLNRHIEHSKVGSLVRVHIVRNGKTKGITLQMARTK